MRLLGFICLKETGFILREILMRISAVLTINKVNQKPVGF